MFNIQELIAQKSEEQNGAPLVMGVLNVTPDSFSDGGSFESQSAIEKQVADMISSGVDMIDVGGESTRPGANKVSLAEELERVIPVVEWVTDRFDIPVSVDTYKAEVMREAVARGVHLINDVNALQSEGAVEVAVETGVTVCLMHKQGESYDMQESPLYGDVVADVQGFLLDRALTCEAAGIAAENIIIDPGFGFGKTLEHNVALFESLDVFTSLKYPVLVGVSKKRMISDILNGAAVEERVIGSVAAAVLATLKGAKIVRVHDVKETVDALRVTMRLM